MGKQERYYINAEIDKSQPDSRSVLEAQCWHYLEWLGQSESHVRWLLTEFPNEDVVRLALSAKRTFEEAALSFQRPGDSDETLTLQIQRKRLLARGNLDA